MPYFESILDTIGNTPLIRLGRVARDIQAIVLAKVEKFNPGGSVKDRIAVAMIDEAEREGRLKPGGTIVESTSGNTGAGLALVAALKGYKAIFTMPDKMSSEKVRTLKAYGAEVIVTPTAVPAESPESYYEVAKKIVRETPNAILANQYFNPENPAIHYKTTGPEIWEQTEGKIDYFVAGMGTGGTISGTGKYLKEQNPDVKVIGADPVGSILKAYFYTKKITAATPYKVEGIGEDIIPGTTHFEYIDEIIEVSDRQSFNMARRLAREEAIFGGGSCGTVAYAALKVAETLPADRVVVVILPDGGERYLSTFYSDDWMRENRFFDIKTASATSILETKSRALSGLISVTPDELVRTGIAKMKEYNISQVPVLEGGHSVGRLEEASIMGLAIDDHNVLSQPVRVFMDDSFPVISRACSMEDVRRTLSRKNAAVLVEEFDEVVGIITKSDLLEFIAQ